MYCLKIQNTNQKKKKAQILIYEFFQKNLKKEKI